MFSLNPLNKRPRGTKVGSKVTMIHGVFSREKSGTRRYYLLVPH